MVQWLYFVAIQRMPVGIALLFEYTAPLLVALWVRFVQRQPVRSRLWLGLACALGGLALVAEFWRGMVLDPLGLVSALGAAAALSAYYLMGEHGQRERDPISLMGYSFGFSALLWAVVQPWWTFPFARLGVAVELPGALPGSTPLGLLVLWIVLLGTVAPFLLVLLAIHHLGAARVGLVGMLEPVSAGIIAWVLLGESLTALQVVGSLVVLVGIVLAETARQPAGAARATPPPHPCRRAWPPDRPPLPAAVGRTSCRLLGESGLRAAENAEPGARSGPRRGVRRWVARAGDGCEGGPREPDRARARPSARSICMPTQKDPWPHGTPCWVDVMVDDADAARAFYTALFGWTADPGPPEFGGYTMCLLEGRPVAGLSPKPESWPGPNVWSTYLAVDDADATMARAAAEDGTVVVEPVTVGPMGRMAFGADPAGGRYGVWQAGEHTGVQVFNEPGSLVWNELMTRDYAKALSFYGAVFGHQFEEIGNGENFTYSTVTRPDGHIVGGIGALDRNMPPEVPSHWVTYFGVADTDAAAARAQELGATLEMAPFDSQFGRIAVVRAPQGETFSIISVEQGQPALGGGVRAGVRGGRRRGDPGPAHRRPRGRRGLNPAAPYRGESGLPAGSGPRADGRVEGGGSGGLGESGPWPRSRTRPRPSRSVPSTGATGRPWRRSSTTCPRRR